MNSHTDIAVFGVPPSDWFEFWPEELVILMLSFVPVQSVLKFGETKNKYQRIAMDIRLWVLLVKRDWPTCYQINVENLPVIAFTSMFDMYKFCP